MIIFGRRVFVFRGVFFSGGDIENLDFRRGLVFIL